MCRICGGQFIFGGQFKGRLTLEATLVVWGVKGTLEAERYLVVSSNDPIFLGRR